MTLSDENKEMIINFGAFHYSSEKIASILGLKQTEIDKELKSTTSELYLLYKKGQDLADYAIDVKLFELARNGDIKAIEKMDLRKRKQK
jgi:IS30 family transposase